MGFAGRKAKHGGKSGIRHDGSRGGVTADAADGRDPHAHAAGLRRPQAGRHRRDALRPGA